MERNGNPDEEATAQAGMHGFMMSDKHEKLIKPLLEDVERAQKTGKLKFVGYKPYIHVYDHKSPDRHPLTSLKPLGIRYRKRFIARAISDLDEMIAHHTQYAREKAKLRDNAQQAAIPLKVTGFWQKLFGNQKKDDLNVKAKEYHNSSEYYSDSVRRMSEARKYLVSKYKANNASSVRPRTRA